MTAAGVPARRRPDPGAAVSGASSHAVSPARAAAWRALLRLRDQRGHMDDSIASLPELDVLEDRDRALANELVTGTLKRRGSVDAVLSQLTKAPLKSTRPAVLEVLRLTAFQLLFLDRVPAYAAVDDAVVMAGESSAAARGFANAVLRTVAAEGRERFAALAAGDDNALVERPLLGAALARRAVAVRARRRGRGADAARPLSRPRSAACGSTR